MTIKSSATTIHGMSTIKAIRDRLGITQAALAESMGCTQGNVGHYERGQTVPPDAAKRLIAFAATRGLELTMDQVYGLAPLPNAQGDCSELASKRSPTNHPGERAADRRPPNPSQPP